MAVDAQYPHLFSPQPQLHIERENMDTLNSLTSIFNNQMVNHPLYNKSIDSKKRKSDSLLDEHLLSQICNHLHDDLEHLILQHVNNARIQLLEKKRRFMSQLNEDLSRRLKSKDDVIEQLKSSNNALEEEIKRIYRENNVWKHYAQKHEAAAIALKAKLEQMLVDQATIKNEEEDVIVGESDDAESCCVGDNYSSAGLWRSCKSCGGGEPSVLLLPCRHLCLCTVCGPRIHTCPVCKCKKNGSVNVYLC